MDTSLLKLILDFIPKPTLLSNTYQNEPNIIELTTPSAVGYRISKAVKPEKAPGDIYVMRLLGSWLSRTKLSNNSSRCKLIALKTG